MSGEARIDRRALVSRHDPVLRSAETGSPLCVGNGEFAFTADVTGMQTLYEEHLRDKVPLCTMSQWGWHSAPAADGGFYSREDLVLGRYESAGKTFRYAGDPQPGNEAVYDWLRRNPHRLNLGRIGLFWRGEEIKAEELSRIEQRLRLYEGVLESRFFFRGGECRVRTACHGELCALGFEIESEALAEGSLEARIRFPYGSPLIEASDWNADEKHETRFEESEPGTIRAMRTLDRDRYRVSARAEEGARAQVAGRHEIRLASAGARLRFTLRFDPGSADGGSTRGEVRFDELMSSSLRHWKDFWESGAAVEFIESTDPRAPELERRVVLSQYLIAVHCCGSSPPQETGLMCNSWYGKFHLEMHPWHCAHLPLWGRSPLLEKSLPWYRSILPRARENAAANGFKGARWPKMVALEGIEGPSWIGAFLIWQQPHPVFILELLRASGGGLDLVERYWDIVRETADFMCDFPRLNPLTGTYDLTPPLIPAQETHAAMDTLNPAFELEYWRFALGIAAGWARALGKPNRLWEEVGASMTMPAVKDGLYAAHANCAGPFEDYAKDHPSMLGALGFLPGERLDRAVMASTLARVFAVWDKQSLWGWDAAMMAMTCARLGMPGLAVDALLMEGPKNRYLANGHNDQGPGSGLPAYLPGNGSLLLAVALMAAGYPGHEEPSPGFPNDGTWTIRHEGLRPFPF